MDGKDQCTVGCVYTSVWGSVCACLHVYVFADEVLRAKEEVQEEEEEEEEKEKRIEEEEEGCSQ